MGEMFSLDADASKGKTAQERAKDWFDHMKEKQKMRKTPAKRRKSNKAHTLHHSRGLASPTFVEEKYGRSVNIRFPLETSDRGNFANSFYS